MSGLFGHPSLPSHDPLVRLQEQDVERRKESAGRVVEYESKVLDIVKKLGGGEGGRGAKWDEVLMELCGTKEYRDGKVEDCEQAFGNLMDKGLLYESTLGVLKVAAWG